MAEKTADCRRQRDEEPSTIRSTPRSWARWLGGEQGVEVETAPVHARSIGHAIVERARERGVDLIVLGSSPRWRRQSAFFSPTVDYVLRNAPCEVLVVAFPQGVLEEA